MKWGIPMFGHVTALEGWRRSAPRPARPATPATFHQKSTCLYVINLRAVFGTHLAQLKAWISTATFHQKSTCVYEINLRALHSCKLTASPATCLNSPHGGLRPPHQKSTCLYAINFRASCGMHLAQIRAISRVAASLQGHIENRSSS